jgi:hypothetical protein
MRKIVDYKIVCGGDVEEVAKSIQDCIGEGWELSGPAYCYQHHHCQTIVKYDEAQTTPNEDSVYSAISQHWVHSEQIRWTLLSNFLMGNSILLVAWATIFVGSNTPPVWARTSVLVVFASAGLVLSFAWIGIVLRSGKFRDMYAKLGSKAEGQPPPVGAPFTSAEAVRLAKRCSTSRSVSGELGSDLKGFAQFARSAESCWQSQSVLPFSTFSLSACPPLAVVS